MLVLEMASGHVGVRDGKVIMLVLEMASDRVGVEMAKS